MSSQSKRRAVGDHACDFADAAPLDCGPGGDGRPVRGRLHPEFTISVAERRRRRARRRPQGATIGTGQVKAGLILPLSAPGNAGVAGQAMRNAAEMAIAEFNAPNIQLLVKDDGGTAGGGPDRRAAIARRRRRDHFGTTVRAVGHLCRPGGAGPQHSGYRLFHRHQCRRERRLSAEFPARIRRRSDRAIFRLDRENTRSRRSSPTIPTARSSKPPSSRWWRGATARSSGSSAIHTIRPAWPGPFGNIAQASARADALFIPDGGDAVPGVVAALAARGVNTKRLQLLGTGLWDDPRIYATPALDGGLLRRRTVSAIGISASATARATSRTPSELLR